MTASDNPHFAGGGEMGKLTREYDWNKTILGPPANWSQSLLTTVATLLRARYPMFLWWGKELIQFYNDAYRPSLGQQGKHPLALGQYGQDCWQEIWPVIGPLISSVMNGGEATWQEDALIPIYRNNQLENVYWTFSYSHVYDMNGGPGGVLVICSETTAKVNYERKLEETIHDLNITGSRLRYLLEEAPVPIALMTGRDLIIESANKRVLEIWGKDSSVIGKPLALALPELVGQPFLPLLEKVYTSGKPFYGNEMRSLLERNGILEEVYTNFVYHPIKGPGDATTSIMLVANIVTEQVWARKELQHSRDTLKFAHDAAELGTFDLDLAHNHLYWDSRCRELFGIDHDDVVTYEHDFVGGLHPDDRERVLAVIAATLNKTETNGEYDIEYRTIGCKDQRIRWVRAKGKAYFNVKDEPLRFAGAVLDITAAKQAEIRKNDFIAMVSHELKTPLTAVKGYVQLLAATNTRAESHVTEIIERLNSQVNKMTGMINGFLNVAKLESGKITLQKSSFLLHELLQQVMEELEVITHHSNFILHNRQPLPIEADYERIGQVISNLLSNAVKYSPKHTPIELSYHANEKRVTISVRDAGSGIPPVDHKRIFDRFYRAADAEAKLIAGFGLGLYLSAAIIEEHNGEIWVENNTDQGATFYFTLPR